MALIENTLWGLRDKVTVAIDRLKQFEPPEGYWVADSGGKDSEVVVDIVSLSGVKAEYNHSLTTIDAPETIWHIRKYHPLTRIIQPAIPLLSFLIENPSYGIPSNIGRWCCSKYKECGGNGRMVVTGIRSAESSKRSGRRMVESCYSNNSGKRFLNPIIEWSDDDVWEYIKQRKLVVNPVYSMGFSRCGCVLCPLARWVDKMKMIDIWPKIAERWMRAARAVHDYKKSKGLSGGNLTFDAFWSMWLHWNAPWKKKDADLTQTTLFGEYESRD